MLGYLLCIGAQRLPQLSRPSSGVMGEVLVVMAGISFPCSLVEGPAWGIRDEAVPVINVWSTYEVSGENARR